MADDTQGTTVQQFFDELLPAGFAAQQAENPSSEDVALQYHVTGEGGGDWSVKIAGGKMTVERGTAPALLTFTLSAPDLLDAINSRNGAVPALVVPAQQRQGASSGAVRALRGTMALNLTRPSGDPFKLEMTFNGATTPRTEMTIALADHVAIQEKRMNAQEAFMTGKMKVQGDMGFLMQVGMATAS
ncbi:MAG TPA: SCP2 sterol-binding domain-containing protein [Candidatus Binatia bacterium]|nr:SCP2 sterol-binding domain-containing protein [Candidatus Binatia bacterium]